MESDARATIKIDIQHPEHMLDAFHVLSKLPSDYCSRISLRMVSDLCSCHDIDWILHGLGLLSEPCLTFELIFNRIEGLSVGEWVWTLLNCDVVRKVAILHCGDETVSLEVLPLLISETRKISELVLSSDLLNESVFKALQGTRLDKVVIVHDRDLPPLEANRLPAIVTVLTETDIVEKT